MNEIWIIVAWVLSPTLHVFQLTESPHTEARFSNENICEQARIEFQQGMESTSKPGFEPQSICVLAHQDDV
jgi:hypothetical protein